MASNEAAKKLLGRSFDEAVKELEAMPDVSEVVIYTRRTGELVGVVEARGLNVVAQYPIVNAVIVRGLKTEILRLLESDLVEAFDIPKKVSKLGREP